MNTNFKSIEKKILRDGWTLVRINGSHYQYKKANNPHTLVIPNHGKRDYGISLIRHLEKITGLTFK